MVLLMVGRMKGVGAVQDTFWRGRERFWQRTEGGSWNVVLTLRTAVWEATHMEDTAISRGQAAPSAVRELGCCVTRGTRQLC